MKKSEFERMVEKAFWGLEAKYGFKKTEIKYAEHSVTVQYLNPTTEVVINYEIGDIPWVSIADAHNAESKSTLGWLLVELGVDKAPTPAQAFRPTALDTSKLEPALQTMGQQILEHGADLLQGNFALMPKLQERARKYAQECKRYSSLRKPKS